MFYQKRGSLDSVTECGFAWKKSCPLLIFHVTLKNQSRAIGFYLIFRPPGKNQSRLKKINLEPSGHTGITAAMTA